MTLLRIEDLRIVFEKGGAAPRTAVRGVTLELRVGETVALAGESGSGKSQTAAAVLGLTPGGGRIASGRIELAGRNLADFSREDWLHTRRHVMAWIPQEPLAALNPCLRLQAQLEESAGGAAAEWLDRVGIADPERVLRQYPRELSGGMAQRAIIAMALARRPQLLVADEPTSALDAIHRRAILDLLLAPVASGECGLLLISHDLEEVRRAARRVLILRAGRVIEQGATDQILWSPVSGYTQELLRASLAGRV